MSSSPSSFHSEPAKIEQIITEFFAKSLHIILESRSPSVSSRNYSGEQTASSLSSSSSSSSVRPRDKWFNLALRESPAALENLDIWRQSNLEPLIVDVILSKRSTSSHLVSCSPASRRSPFRNISSRDQRHQIWSLGQEEFVPDKKNGRVIERWVLQYENQKGGCTMRDSKFGIKKTSGASSQSSEVLAIYRKTYKKSIILLRSLYAMVRLLPAYNLFRDLNCSGQIHPFNLSYRVSSFVEPFSRKQEAEMQQFSFVPVETCCGRLCLSVVYQATITDVKSEPCIPMSPQIIADYVGSPTTDRLRRFPIVPLAGLMSRSPGSPSSVPFARRHSWSSDLHRAAPSFSPSPSPTYSDSNALPSNLNSLHPPSHFLNVNMSPSSHLPQHPPDNMPLTQKERTSFDEYWPSPPFSPSPSPSPSPPTHFPGNNLSKALLRSESAPVSIPSGTFGRGLPPSASPKSAKSHHPSHLENAKVQSSQELACQRSQAESTSKKMLYSTRIQELQASGTSRKVDVGKTIGGVRVSSSSSPHVPISRSFGRLPFQDEFDDSEFACPFAVDDEDLMGLVNRTEDSSGKGQISEGAESGGLLPIRKSQDAAVGALVRMLKSAPPLRQDCSLSAKFSESSRAGSPKPATETRESVAGDTSWESGIVASGLLMSRTTADALEELKSYKEMKDSLLQQGESKPSDRS